MKKKFLIIAAAAAVILTSAGAGAWWWFGKAPADPSVPVAAEKDKTEYKFARLDKVFVMLRSPEGSNFSTPAAVDLVFKVPAKTASAIKDDLPLLQAITHRTLAAKTRAELQALTSEQVADLLDQAYQKAYEEEGRDRPFRSVMIGKLIVE